MTNSEAACETEQSRSFSKLNFISLAIFGPEVKQIITSTFASLSSAGCFAEGPFNPILISSNLQQSSDSLEYEMKC